MLAARPETVRKNKAINAEPATIAMARQFKYLSAYRPAGFAWMTQDLHDTGAVGDATQATAKKGEAALEHGATAFVELLREVDRFDLARLREGPLAEPFSSSPAKAGGG
jgi:creatinine amidohydrolase